jgi:hypothetical protein
VVRRADLSTCWGVRFDDVPPVRSFPSLRSQAHFPGLRWSATSGRHVGYESWLERDHAMLLDFDPEVVGYSSQPFWLRWHDGRRRREAPDFFVRLIDGTGVVVDVRADDRIEVRDDEVFAATERACAQVGWRFGGSASWTRCSQRTCAGWRAIAIPGATGRPSRPNCWRCSRNRAACSTERMGHWGRPAFWTRRVRFGEPRPARGVTGRGSGVSGIGGPHGGWVRRHDGAARG